MEDRSTRETITLIVKPHSDEMASGLLREATALKDRGALGEAIEVLKTAYTEIAKGGVDYGIQTFLRLPLYLQAAGRHDEAWSEFNRLLGSGYPNMLEGDAWWHQMEATVYDKMRLFLQREKKPRDAVVYGVLSFIAGHRANVAQGKENAFFRTRFEEGTSREAIEAMLAPLLKKASVSQKAVACSEVMGKWVRALPEADDCKFEQEISAIVLTA